MGEDHAEAKRPEPCGFGMDEPQRALHENQQGERAEDQGDVERNTIAPLRPLRHHHDGEQDHRALREPLEERLKAQTAIISRLSYWSTAPLTTEPSTPPTSSAWTMNR